jgi:transposase
MPQNFIESRGEQGFLLPPDVRDWVPPDHLAWFVIDAVKEMKLGAFYGAYRADGHGRAAYDPQMMVTLILFGFATGVQSSRAIERHCREHVAYRVIAGNLVPDHVTIARFICRHGQALAALFSQVLGLCAEAGLVDSGVVAIDGTRIAANASRERNQEFGQIAMEIVEQVKATDEAEDEEFGEARGDELPEQLRTPEGRREFLRRARQKLKGHAGGQELGEGAEPDAETGGERVRPGPGPALSAPGAPDASPRPSVRVANVRSACASVPGRGLRVGGRLGQVGNAASWAVARWTSVVIPRLRAVVRALCSRLCPRSGSSLDWRVSSICA